MREAGGQLRHRRRRATEGWRRDVNQCSAVAVHKTPGCAAIRADNRAYNQQAKAWETIMFLLRSPAVAGWLLAGAGAYSTGAAWAGNGQTGKLHPWVLVAVFWGVALLSVSVHYLRQYLAQAAAWARRSWHQNAPERARLMRRARLTLAQASAGEALLAPARDRGGEAPRRAGPRPRHRSGRGTPGTGTRPRGRGSSAAPGSRWPGPPARSCAPCAISPTGTRRWRAPAPWSVRAGRRPGTPQSSRSRAHAARPALWSAGRGRRSRPYGRERIRGAMRSMRLVQMPPA